MNTKPMIFTAEMVQAILVGRKTQTRRIIPYSIQHKYCEYSDHIDVTIPPGSPELSTRTSEHDFYMMKSRYQIGNILWVKETWSQDDDGISFRVLDNGQAFVDDGSIKWKSSRYMPKKAARIFLKVVDLRVERLQDISAEDCRAEGINVTVYNFDDFPYGKHSSLVEKFIGTENGEFRNQSAWYREWFSELWDFLNGKRDGGAYAWGKNPYVWAINFERAEKPEGWC